MAKNQLHVDILGTSLTIQSEDQRDYLEQVVEYLRRRLEETRLAFRGADALKISLITSLNIVDELFKERTRVGQGGTNRVDEIARNLIVKIDQCLSEEGNMSR